MPALALTLLSLVAAAAATGQDAADLVKQATAALDAGRADEARALVDRAVAQDPADAAARRLRAALHEAAGRYSEALADVTRLAELQPAEATHDQRRGILHFKLGQVEAAVRDFDRYLERRPEQKAGHWQRGIACYYAGRYDEGRRQFEGYQAVDTNDVENAVWRYLCMARLDGPERARKDMLPIGDDRRVPMRQVYELFKGDLGLDDVLAAARAGAPGKDELNRRLFYAHLYVGIYYDLAGDRTRALDHLEQAVAHRIGHYMWDVARVHRDLLRRKKSE